MSTNTTPSTSTNSHDYTVDVPFVSALEKSNIYNCIKDAVIKISKIFQIFKNYE